MGYMGIVIVATIFATTSTIPIHHMRPLSQKIQINQVLFIQYFANHLIEQSF